MSKALRVITLSTILLVWLTAICGASAFRIGDQGSDVAEIQGQLASLGYDVAADGDFGPATAEAVKAFQVSRARKHHHNSNQNKFGYFRIALIHGGYNCTLLFLSFLYYNMGTS